VLSDQLLRGAAAADRSRTSRHWFRPDKRLLPLIPRLAGSTAIHFRVGNALTAKPLLAPCGLAMQHDEAARGKTGAIRAPRRTQTFPIATSTLRLPEQPG